MNNARMGEGIDQYETRRNIHSIINDLFAPASVYAFSPHAIITQEKEFPDVSFYQGDINWSVMRTQTDAVIIRVGQGRWVDEQFVRNWTEARHAGIKRSCYWFYDDRVDPGTQAATLVGLLSGDLPEMEIWCDWENSYGGAFGGLRNVVAFMQRVEELLQGVRVGLYTGYYFFREHSNVLTNAAQYNYLKAHSLWLAWYTFNASLVLIPAPWTELLLWQRGTPPIGLRYGVRSIEIDMNVYNGTQIQFDERYGGSSVPVPPSGGSMKQYKVIWTAGVARRSAPTTSNSSTTLPKYDFGQIVDVVEDNIPDQTSPGDPYKRWVRFLDGRFGASNYPDGDSTEVRMIDVTPDSPPVNELPIIWDVTQVARDENGEVLATYKGTLTKE